MIIRCRKVLPLLAAMAAVIFGSSACTPRSSSGYALFGQVFTVTGQWSGTISDSAGPDRPVTLSFVDNNGVVSGTLQAPGHSCVPSGKVSGTSTPAPASSTGDNPLTVDNENSTGGFLTLAPELGSKVVDVEILQSGSGYTEPVSVEFATPAAGGRRATGIAIIGSGEATTSDGGGSNGSTAVSAGSLQAGVQYAIVTAGDTDFTLIGAADSNPGTVFTATGPGAGTGTASATGSGNAGAGVALGGGVSGVIITDPGSGYTFPPAVFFEGGEGSGALGQAAIQGVDSVEISMSGTARAMTGTWTSVGSEGKCLINSSGSIKVSRI